MPHRPTISAVAPLTIAQVSPYTWGTDNEVNRGIERVAGELVRRGHRVAIVAPSPSHAAVRETRRRLRDGMVWQSGGPEVLAVSEAIAPQGRRAALPVDVGRAIDALFEAVAFDIVHVHEPWAPSVASAALRSSPALNVGTFGAPTERVVSTQVARKLVGLVFGRLDARIASFEATADLMRRFFPGDYRVVMPGADPLPRTAADGPPRIVFVEEEERAALRLFLRALRRLEPALDWEATVVSPRPSSSTPLRSELRDRISFVDGGADEALAAADILVAASDGAGPAPGLIVRALAAGAVPLAARLPVYEELLDDGRGLLFEPDDSEVLAGQLARLITDGPLRERLRAGADALRDQLTWERVADDLERVYVELVARRHPTDGNPAVRARLRRRKLIDVDLHMHTDHSGDCATPVEVLLATARDQGLGAIAITDHNEVSGALDAAAKAEQFGVKVIVAEEVKTAEQGEVIGLFLKEKIPRGLTLQETVAEIRRQGGLVYVPHPFDRMHSVPDYEHLLAILGDIDAIEVYNPRVAIGSFNEEAARFARKYRIVAGAGSDSHVAQGLGSVRIRMHDFDGPEEFLESLRTADIVTKPSSLLYVQALKFLETKATPAGARRARKERRVRRATRKA
ncbi:MAG: glycosyltransferase [Solirubrobacteraceae bacterium]|nr:glycosyltransferase [Solirubrobacteraceae bacterium]